MRPIVWGFIVTVVGAFFWVLFSVIFGFGAALRGEIPPAGMFLIYVTGFVTWFSLPISIAIEIYRWIKGRKAKKESSKWLYSIYYLH